MLTLGYSRQSALSALKIAEASDGRIEAIRGPADINWGRRSMPGARLNPSIANAVNKRWMRELFAEQGVPAPRLLTPAEAIGHLLMNPHTDSPATFVGRPDYHTRGRGLWLCETAEQAGRAMRGTRRKMAATHFIDFVYLPTEYRVHVFGGRSIRMSVKDFVDGRKYITRKPPEGPKRHIRDAAKQAVAALGLDFGTVDILADETTAMVLEVNTAPGLGGSMPKLWATTFINHLEGDDDDE